VDRESDRGRAGVNGRVPCCLRVILGLRAFVDYTRDCQKAQSTWTKSFTSEFDQETEHPIFMDVAAKIRETISAALAKLVDEWPAVATRRPRLSVDVVCGY